MEVPAARIEVAEQWVVLVPDNALAVGDGYTLVTDTIYSAKTRRAPTRRTRSTSSTTDCAGHPP